MYPQILVPVDGSATAERGLGEAIELARALGASLRLLHVIDTDLLYVEMAPAALVRQTLDRIAENGQALLAAARARVEAAGVPVRTALRRSEGRRVGELVIDSARTAPADLVVMGTHGRRGFNPDALGGDAGIVARGCPVPVLLVRAP